MAGMGVKRMGDEKGLKTKSPKPPRRKAKPVAKPTDMKSDTKRIDDLERALTHIKEQRSDAEEKLSTLQKRVRRLKKQLASAEEQLSQPKPTVADVLATWGLETPTDRAQVLADAEWAERIISEPKLIESSELKEAVQSKWEWLCEACDVGPGKSKLVVSSERCGFCGGFDLKTQARRFIDAALINGRLRIVVVGRDSRDHRRIRKWITDSRLILTQLPGAVRRDLDAAQMDADNADVVVIWDPDSVDEEHLEIYRNARRVGEVPAGSLGAFLVAAAQIIGAD